MIDIKELHIGSHVRIGGKICRIAAIDALNGQIGIDAYTMDAKGVKHPFGYKIEDVEPIPITEELLTELGFECIARYNESWWQRGNKRIKIKGNYVEVEVYQGFYDATWRCVYLHELEAFLYLTTKTELIKE